MNVVGKVGSLISQGVYSVATPFHPFGGAVDIIAVQQQDGTFRSTPWYVRFGKFQGVLKGAEKMVRIAVNGTEANFHMYLDNSGEAYFIREVDSSGSDDLGGILKESDSFGDALKDVSSANDDINSEKGTGNLGIFEGTVSDDVEVQLQDENISLGVERIERTQSDVERRFFEFPDEQASLEGSAELSEYGSSRCDNLDGVEHYVESRNSSSEVVLVSVDGHILTAPILNSEGHSDNVQLSTPQFHLGPGEGTEFCEDGAEFSTGEDTWTAEYLGDLSASAPQVADDTSCKVNDDSNVPWNQLEVCEENRENVCQDQEDRYDTRQVGESCADSDEKAVSASIKNEDVFKSCLELSELASLVGTADQDDMDSQLEIHDKMDNSQVAGEAEAGGVDKLVNGDRLAVSDSDSQTGVTPVEQKAKDASDVSFGHTFTESVDNINDKQEENVSMALAVEGMKSDQLVSPPEDEPGKIQTRESPIASSSEWLKDESNTRLELSLCGNLLNAGMGLSSAAEVFDAHRISEEEFKLSAASLIKNENLVIRFRNRYLPWDKAAPIVLGVAVYDVELSVEPKDAIPVDQDDTPKSGVDVSGITSTPSGRKWRLWPMPFRRVKTLEHTSSNSSSEDAFVDSESVSQSPPQEQTLASHGGSVSPHKQLIRTNVPTTEQIASLNLKEGQNVVTFNFSTRVLGMQQVDAHIYLWKWNARIVISDVDGTITKSDVLGQFMPLVGKDWTQSGVARLFTAIKENGYQLLFLSARAIVQAYLTRSFLLNLKQDGKNLPNGPVVISPDGLFPSLYREVIRRAPHEFKIACLEDIKALFPPDYNPFYAGFGNRDTDELSYRKIGIPKGKIFIINPKGEVAISQHRLDVKSYTSLHTLVNDMFPPTSMVEQEDFNSWNFWRMPPPDVEC